MLLDGDRWGAPPPWYDKFKGTYPPMGSGSPVSYTPTTPAQNLYSDHALNSRSQMKDEGYTILRQPRLESRAMTMGELVQMKSGDGKTFKMSNAYVTDPLLHVAMNVLLLGGAIYIITTTPYPGLKIVGWIVAGGTLINLAKVAKELLSEPTAAYQKVNPSYDV